MSSTTDSHGTATPSQGPAAPARAVSPLLILTMVTVGVLGAVVLTYLTWRHPSLGTPLQVAFGGLTLFVTAALTLGLRR